MSLVHTRQYLFKRDDDMTNITYVQHMAIQDQNKRHEEVKKDFEYMCSKCDKADCKKEYKKQFDCYYNH